MRTITAAFCFPIYVAFIFSSAVAEDGSVQNEDETEIISSPTANPESLYKGSPHVNALLKFTIPVLDFDSAIKEYSLPVGRRSSVVVSMSNTHDGIAYPRFSFHSVEGSLHYPGYYGYRIQNLTVIPLQNTVEPGQELYEIEEGVDTEMIFLVLLIVALGVFLLVGIWHWCYSKTSRRKAAQFSSQDDPLISGSSKNEYTALIQNSKTTRTERSAATVTRRHGRR